MFNIQYIGPISEKKNVTEVTLYFVETVIFFFHKHIELHDCVYSKYFLRHDNSVNYSLNVSLCVNFLGDEVFENSMFSSLVHMIRDSDIYEAQIISY